MTVVLTQATSSRRAGTAAVGAAALGAGAILLGFAGLQIALAAGAPLGEHVWGGTQERALPTSMRAIAAIALGAATTKLFLLRAHESDDVEILTRIAPDT